MADRLERMRHTLGFSPNGTRLVTRGRRLLTRRVRGADRGLSILGRTRSRIRTRFRHKSVKTRRCETFRQRLTAARTRLRRCGTRVTDATGRRSQLTHAANRLSTFFRTANASIGRFTSLLNAHLAGTVESNSTAASRVGHTLHLVKRRTLNTNTSVSRVQATLQETTRNTSLGKMERSLTEVARRTGRTRRTIGKFNRRLSSITTKLTTNKKLTMTVRRTLSISGLGAGVSVSVGLGRRSTRTMHRSVVRAATTVKSRRTTCRNMHERVILGGSTSVRSGRRVVGNTTVVSDTCGRVSFGRLVRRSFRVNGRLGVSRGSTLTLAGRLLDINFPARRLSVVTRCNKRLRETKFSTGRIRKVVTTNIRAKA